MKLFFVILAVILFTFSTKAAEIWHQGTIADMYIYPEYAVIVHAGTSISFAWSDFSPQAQGRIMAMLLNAKNIVSSIGLVYDTDDKSGPEGKPKLRTGQFVIH